MWGAALVVVLWYFLTDPDGGVETMLRVQHLAWGIVILGLVWVGRKVLNEKVKLADIAERAMKDPIGAGLVYLGCSIVMAALVLAWMGRASAYEMPPRALQALPVLDAEISAHWATHPMRSAVGALIDKETCYSARHSKCWNPRAELKTSREYGFGLGQVTIAYRADGSERFNKHAELVAAHRELTGWTWANRFDAKMQLRALVLMNRSCYRRVVRMIGDPYHTLAMCDAAYNGGLGGMLAERRACAAAPGCDPDQWFGHVERHCLKSKVKWQGYGQSACDINRGHVRAVLIERRDPYRQWWGEA